MLTRVGGWLFRHRTVIPLPIALALIILPPASSSVDLVWLGLLTVVFGELLRLTAVRHIGTISRTRTDRLGPRVASVLALVAQLPWLVAPIAFLLALEYHAIVRWEEELLAERLGQPYREYLRTVPRWIPRPPQPTGNPAPPAFGWKETLFSERGTLTAIAVGLALLWLKSKSEG